MSFLRDVPAVEPTQRTAAPTGPSGEVVWIEHDVEPNGELRYEACSAWGKRQMCNDLWQAEIYAERLRSHAA